MMKRYPNARWGWIAAGLVVLLALLLPVPAAAHGPADGGANTDTINRLFKITLFIAIPIFILVEGLILFAVIRYRRRKQDEMPEQVHGNPQLEIAWTGFAFLIVGVLFVLTLRALQTDYKVQADNESNNPDYTVRVTGYLFNWDYEYFIGSDEETGVLTTKRLTIPVNKAVLLKITSRDVQHSFWVPDLAGKIDAIPGYINTMWLKVDKPGLYIGNCAEYCGLNHYNMLIEVEVLEQSAFDTWLAGQMAAAGQFVAIGTDLTSPLPPGDAERGAQVFANLVCNACHAPQYDQSSGPAVARMMKDASQRPDYTADAYLRESILLPCAVLASGWDQCIMPQNYGERMSAQDLADVIEYLKTQ